MKKHNFYAGPSIMPQYTNDMVIEAIRDFAGTGLSIMEVSHRSKEFVAVMESAVSHVKELLDVPEGDMSSDIFSRPVDVSKYSVIYGGAQKNLAPAGVTFVIIKDSVLGKVTRPIPTMLNYKTHIEKESMFNTPPVMVVFAALKTLEWLKQKGGLSAMQRINREKAAMLYDEIERNKLFMATVPDHNDRSLMNACFVMAEGYTELEKDFADFAKSKGMIGIAGHRSVGGFRASLYNALPVESVAALVDCMKEFEKKN